MSSNSIALRLSGMFTLVALLVFLLIGGALYQQVDKGLGLLPEAELEARYSVLESALNRFGTPEHWVKINAKLKLLGEEDKRIRFWVVSGDPGYEYGAPDSRIRAFAQGPLGMLTCTAGACLSMKVLLTELPQGQRRAALHDGIDTETFTRPSTTC